MTLILGIVILYYYLNKDNLNNVFSSVKMLPAASSYIQRSHRYHSFNHYLIISLVHDWILLVCYIIKINYVKILRPNTNGW